MRDPACARMKCMLRFLLVGSIAGAAVALAGSMGVVVLLTAPNPAAIPSAPVELHARSVRISSASGAVIDAWFSAGTSGRGAVLLLHGVHANRLAMLGRARFLVAAGYSVLLIDFRAHGASSGDAITFGYLESRDARAAFDALGRLAPGEKIGVIGTSMGGAAFVLARPALDADAVVLEQVYPTVLEALDNRLRLYLGGAGDVVAPLLAAEFELWLHVDSGELRPIDAIAGVRAPLFVLGGDTDKHTTLAQTRALFAAALEPKTLWIVPGAAHVDLATYAGDEYRERILAFFNNYLSPDDAAQSDTARAIPSAATSNIKSISAVVTQNGGMK